MEDEKNTELENEVTEENVLDAEEYAEDSSDGRDDEFEYDEDGNIIIPDPVFDDDDDEYVIEDDEAEEPQDEPEEREAEEEPAPEEVVEPASDTNAKDEEIEALKRELAAYKAQTKDTLKKLGVESDNEMEGLVKLAAEADDKTPEEYLKKREEEALKEEGERLRKQAAYQKMIAEDIAAIHAAYPETKKYKSVEQFPNFKRFGELRDAGNTPEEAFAASHRDEVRQSVAESTRQQSLNDTKNHLKSNVPKKAKQEAPIRMTKKEMDEWKNLFPHKTEKEILEHYRKTRIN